MLYQATINVNFPVEPGMYRARWTGHTIHFEYRDTELTATTVEDCQATDKPCWLVVDREYAGVCDDRDEAYEIALAGIP